MSAKSSTSGRPKTGGRASKSARAPAEENSEEGDLVFLLAEKDFFRFRPLITQLFSEIRSKD